MLSGYFKRLLMARQVRFMEGDVSIFDVDHALVPTAHYVHLRALLGKKHGKEGIALLYHAGKTTSQGIADHFAKKFRAQRQESLFFWQNIIELTGIAEMKAMTLKEEAITVHVVSAFAKTFVETEGQKKGARIDEFLAGYLAGIFSTIYKKNFECSEANCIASGSAQCTFVLKAK